MCASCDSIEDHPRSEFISVFLYSSIALNLKWMYAVYDNIEDPSRNKYFSTSDYSFIRFTSKWMDTITIKLTITTEMNIFQY
jgi:hypothetical protein